MDEPAALPFPPGATAPEGDERAWLPVRAAFLEDRAAAASPVLAGAREVRWSSTAADCFVALLDDLAHEVALLAGVTEDLLEAVTWLCAAGAQAEDALDALDAALAAAALAGVAQ